METSCIQAQYGESAKPAQKTVGKVENYRDDLYWHNAYKTRGPGGSRPVSFRLDRNTCPASCGTLRLICTGELGYVKSGTVLQYGNSAALA